MQSRQEHSHQQTVHFLSPSEHVTWEAKYQRVTWWAWNQSKGVSQSQETSVSQLRHSTLVMFLNPDCMLESPGRDCLSAHF